MPMDNDLKWELTTDHPKSSYGMPVFVFEGLAFGPRDKIGHRLVAKLVFDWASQHDQSAENKRLAGIFLRQWPDGPQLTHVPGLMGQPKRWPKTTPVLVRVPDEHLLKIKSTGQKTATFINQAIGEKIERMDKQS